MKKLELYFAYFLIAVYCINITACKDDDDESQSKAIEESLSVACTEWGLSQEEVTTRMKGYSGRSDNGDYEDFLQFSAKGITIAYEFKDGALNATSIVIPDNNSEFDATTYLNGYKYLGEISGTYMYSKESDNIVGMVCDDVNDGKKYHIIGLAPIN